MHRLRHCLGGGCYCLFRGGLLQRAPVPHMERSAAVRPTSASGAESSTVQSIFVSTSPAVKTLPGTDAPYGALESGGTREAAAKHQNLAILHAEIWRGAPMLVMSS
jgi:hypothetical protein